MPSIQRSFFRSSAVNLAGVAGVGVACVEGVFADIAAGFEVQLMMGRVSSANVITYVSLGINVCLLKQEPDGLSESQNPGRISGTDLLFITLGDRQTLNALLHLIQTANLMRIVTPRQNVIYTGEIDCHRQCVHIKVY